MDSLIGTVKSESTPPASPEPAMELSASKTPPHANSLSTSELGSLSRPKTKTYKEGEGDFVFVHPDAAGVNALADLLNLIQKKLDSSSGSPSSYSPSSSPNTPSSLSLGNFFFNPSIFIPLLLRLLPKNEQQLNSAFPSPQLTFIEKRIELGYLSWRTQRKGAPRFH